MPERLAINICPDESIIQMMGGMKKRKQIKGEESGRRREWGGSWLV